MTLLCHGATRSMRVGGFGASHEPLDEGGICKVAGLKRTIGVPSFVLTSPAMAACQTAAGLGWTATVDDRLRDIAVGPWSGLDFADVMSRDATGFQAWIERPEDGAPSGETMAQVRSRAAEWLAEQTASSGEVMAVTHPMVIRAALSAALDLPLGCAMRFDIAPLSTATLSHNGIWRLQSFGS